MSCYSVSRARAQLLSARVMAELDKRAPGVRAQAAQHVAKAQALIKTHVTDAEWVSAGCSRGWGGCSRGSGLVVAVHRCVSGSRVRGGGL